MKNKFPDWLDPDKRIHDVRLFRSEAELQHDILKRLNGVEGIIFGSEIQFGNRIVDIAWIDSQGLVHAVELKLTNWKGAMDQAKDYILWGVNYSYICMPPKLRGVPKTAKKACTEAGIGYLEYVPPNEYKVRNSGRCTYTISFDYSYPFKSVVCPRLVKTEDIHYTDERRELVNTLEFLHFNKLANARKLVKANAKMKFPKWLKRPVDKKGSR